MIFTVAVGLVLYAFELRWRRANRNSRAEDIGEANAADPNQASDDAGDAGDSGETALQDEAEGSECCGLHLVCEKDSLSPMSDEIVYYDDEELDRFIGRDPNSYSAEETEEFRDVLMTLRPDDVAGWARSVTQRRLELPPDVRDELLMLVNEQRQAH